PGEDGTDPHRVAGTVHLDALCTRDALARRFRQLRFETRLRIRLASQSASANRSAAKREKDARIVEAGQNRLFDLVERDHAAGQSVLKALERPWDLPDAVRRIVPAPLRNRVALDDRLQDDGVVRVQPEGHLLFAGGTVDGCASQRGDIAVEPTGLGLEGPVVHEAVPDVDVEELVECSSARISGALSDRC